MNKYVLILTLFFITTIIEAQQNNETVVANNALVIVLLIIFIILLILDILTRRRKPEDSDVFKQLKDDNQQLKEESNANKIRADESKDHYTKIEAKYEQSSNLINEQKAEINQFKSKNEQREKEHDEKINKLEESRNALTQERQRIIEEEQKKRKIDEENRTRIWNEHEENAKLYMAGICRKSGIGLSSFDNKNLPEGFDNSIKPDFMVRLLDQYIIFDSKRSTGTNLQSYLANQAKSTAQKINKSQNSNDIYKTVFFVVPGIAIPDLKETYYLENGISFYIIPLEAFEPIIRTLKRLEDYDLADKYDPQERENIVTVLATFDNHIREQNAANTLMTMRGIQTLSSKEFIPSDVIDDIEARRKKLSITGISQTQLKKLMNNPDIQIEDLRKIIVPQTPPIDAEDIIQANNVISNKEEKKDT